MVEARGQLHLVQVSEARFGGSLKDNVHWGLCGACLRTLILTINETTLDFRRIQGNKIDLEVSSLLLRESHEGKNSEGKEQCDRTHSSPAALQLNIQPLNPTPQ